MKMPKGQQSRSPNDAPTDRADREKQIRLQAQLRRIREAGETP